MKTDQISSQATDRRAFLKGVGMTGLGLASAAAVVTNLASPLEKVRAAGVSDIDILNFALNLEYLEAEYYMVSSFGRTLVQSGILDPADTTGETTGGQMIPTINTAMPVSYLASALRSNEVDHVILLRNALGASAVPKPTINLDALGYGFASISDFYKISRQLEEVGTSAYLGAAPLITNKDYLAAAASILAVEAKHTGALRLACIQNGVVSPAVDSIDIPPTAQQPFSAPKQGLTTPRSTSQVLNIVYGGQTGGGGFYPDGMNGTIK